MAAATDRHRNSSIERPPGAEANPPGPGNSRRKAIHRKRPRLADPDPNDGKGHRQERRTQTLQRSEVIHLNRAAASQTRSPVAPAATVAALAMHCAHMPPL